MNPKAVDRGPRLGWALEWPDGFISAMPSEEAARRCERPPVWVVFRECDGETSIKVCYSEKESEAEVESVLREWIAKNREYYADVFQNRIAYTPELGEHAAKVERACKDIESLLDKGEVAEALLSDQMELVRDEDDYLHVFDSAGGRTA